MFDITRLRMVEWTHPFVRSLAYRIWFYNNYIVRSYYHQVGVCYDKDTAMFIV